MPSKKELCRSWKLYVITDNSAVISGTLVDAVKAAVQNGASVVQLRDKRSSDTEFAEIARGLLSVTRQAGVPLIINDRIEVAKIIGADGVHLGQQDASLKAARERLGHDIIIGRSTHSQEQALEAQRQGFDYIGIGPVFSTPTKPEYAPVGLDLVRFATTNIHIPFVAIGGIDTSNIQQVLRAGARTVAVVRAIMGARNPGEATKELLCKIKITY